MKTDSVISVGKSNGEANKLSLADRSVHDWYRFVLSFPPHLVRYYLEKFGITARHMVLDPFCGTGTTLVECKKQGIPSVGVEAHPMTSFASRVKINWSVDPRGMGEHARKLARLAEDTFKAGTDLALSDDAEKLLLKNSISPKPLRRSLALLDALNGQDQNEYRGHELLALAKTLVHSAGNLRFGPEVGVGKIRKDAEVVLHWLENVRIIRRDLADLQCMAGIESRIYLDDSREVAEKLDAGSINAVITSPPYPNEKDYTRTTRLESVILGFIRTRKELQNFKRTLIRSNTRNIYKEDMDDENIYNCPEILRLAEQIEARRIELKKTSGFERLYANVTRQYFGGMARHLASLRRALAPGAYLAYVVGDQASFFRIMIRTGELLSKIAVSLGYQHIGTDLFRTRLSTATRDQLREEVVILCWPG